MRNKKIPLFSIFLFLFLSFTTNVNPPNEIVVYLTYSTCSVCPDDPVQGMLNRYLVEIQTLSEFDADMQIRTVDDEPNLEDDLADLYERVGVPLDIPNSLTLVVSVDEKYLFVNHVPGRIIYDFLEKHSSEYDRIIVYKETVQDFYRIVDDSGNVVTCEVKDSISECSQLSLGSSNSAQIMSLVVVSGLLDGINPCAFTVILFLVTFLLSRNSMLPEDSHSQKRRTLSLGLVYILSVYLTYLAIGLSLKEAIGLIPFPHLISTITSLIVVVFGVSKAMDTFYPGRGFGWRLSPSQWDRIRRWMRKSSFPAVVLVGALVALFEFPCTGGIYLAILSILATETTFAKGLLYLIVYNIAFVMPLVFILVIATKKEVLSFSIKEWEHKRGKKIRLLESIVYICLGLFLFISSFL